MLTGQFGVSIIDTFARQRAYAYFNDLRLGDVARDIVARRLRLAPDHDLSADHEAYDAHAARRGPAAGPAIFREKVSAWTGNCWRRRLSS
jgi:hypothetical protein